MSVKYKVLIIIVYISIVIGAVIFFVRNYTNNNVELNSFVSKEITGHIVALKDQNRGSYYIEIKNLEENYKIQGLPIAWDIKEYNIQVGDSISKGAYSKIITIYKFKNGSYEKCCVFEM